MCRGETKGNKKIASLIPVTFFVRALVRVCVFVLGEEYNVVVILF